MTTVAVQPSMGGWGMDKRADLLRGIFGARTRLGAWLLQRRLDRLPLELAADGVREAPSIDGESTLTLPPRRRTRCAFCDRRRMCFDWRVRGTDLTVPTCEECLIYEGAQQRAAEAVP